MIVRIIWNICYNVTRCVMLCTENELVESFDYRYKKAFVKVN
jgi:hypothetical protein